tara:strand:+ start:885 stop:1127 length:243 start_codon:yes stop_codon:yes gene_type:complete
VTRTLFSQLSEQHKAYTEDLSAYVAKGEEWVRRIYNVRLRYGVTEKEGYDIMDAGNEIAFRRIMFGFGPGRMPPTPEWRR